MTPDIPAVTRFLHLAEQLNQEQHWSLAPQVLHSYALQLAACWHDLADANDKRLCTAITNFHLDHATVAQLRQIDRIENATAWMEWMTRAIKLMRTRRADLYIVDAVAADLDDLVQEALIDLWNGLPSFRYESRFHTWAKTVIANCLARHHRTITSGKHAPNRAMHSLDVLLSSGADVHDEAIVRAEERIHSDNITRLVRDVLGQHPDARLQRVFNLHVFESQSMRAIGKDLQLSPARVYSLICQATALVLDGLKQEFWLDPDAANQNSEHTARNRLY